MTALVHDDEAVCAADYEGEESRYAIYSVAPTYVYEPSLSTPGRARLAETSLGGIGLCLHTLRAEGDLSEDSRVGIFDRLHRDWLVNPWARGDRP